jgi:hypothetical protein
MIVAFVRWNESFGRPPTKRLYAFVVPKPIAFRKGWPGENWPNEPPVQFAATFSVLLVTMIPCDDWTSRSPYPLVWKNVERMSVSVNVSPGARGGFKVTGEEPEPSESAGVKKKLTVTDDVLGLRTVTSLV